MRKINDEFCDFKFATEDEVSFTAKIIDGKRRYAFVSASFVSPEKKGEIIPENRGNCFLNENGGIVAVNYLSPFEFEKIENVCLGADQYYIVKKEGLWGLYGRQGEEVIPCRYEVFQASSSSGLASVMRNGLWGLVDQNLSEVVPCLYQVITFFREGYAAVKKDGMWGIINKKGEEIVPCRYEYTSFFWEGYATAKKDGLYGFVNKKGEEIIPCR